MAAIEMLLTSRVQALGVEISKIQHDEPANPRMGLADDVQDLIEEASDIVAQLVDFRDRMRKSLADSSTPIRALDQSFVDSTLSTVQQFEQLVSVAGLLVHAGVPIEGVPQLSKSLETVRDITTDLKTWPVRRPGRLAEARRQREVEGTVDLTRAS